MYLHSIIIYFVWPVLILVSYLVIRFALKKLDKKDENKEEMTDIPV